MHDRAARTRPGRPRWVPMASVLAIGLCAFAAWNGGHVLSPRHIGWLMSGLDTPTQYLSWAFFRDTPWTQWPLGVNPRFGSDAPGTIVLADGIPLLALFFKTWRGWLPEPFQYMGLWVGICFVLQAGFGYRLMGAFSADEPSRLVGAALLVTASVFLLRTYIHPALAGHWLLLAALCLALTPQWRPWRWCAVLALAVLVHAYLFAMTAAIWLCALTDRFVAAPVLRLRLAIHLVLSVTLVCLLMWAAGYFVPAATAPMPVRSYTDLVAPFTAGYCGGGEWSWVMPCLPFGPALAVSDGFGYLGVGLLLLIPLAAVLALTQPVRFAGAWQVRAWRPALVAALILLAYALGNRIQVAGHVLLSLPLPGALDRLAHVFRGAARMEWPAWYLVALVALGTIAARLPTRYARIVLLAALAVQCADLSRAAIELRRHPHTAWNVRDPLPAASWRTIASRYRHMVFVLPTQVSPYVVGWNEHYLRVGLFAARQHMSINVAALARLDERALTAARARHVSALVDGPLEADSVYVIEDEALWPRVACVPHRGDWRGHLDGLELVLPGGADLHGLPPTEPCPR